MKNRNPFLSFVLSLIIPGLGQLYNGEIRKAIIFVVLIFPLYLILGFAGVISTFTGFVAHVILIIVYKLYVAYDAYRISKKLSPYTFKKVNKLWIYTLFGIVAYAVTWYGVQLNRYLIGYETFDIPTPSMQPTIEIDDRIIATSVKPENVNRGDIITFQRDDGQSYISRVVGLENESISIVNDKVVFGNGEEIHTRVDKSSDDMFDYQEYMVEMPNQVKFVICKIEKVNGKEFLPQKTSNIEKLIIPDDHLYVVSDNRNNGMDSRTYGPIPMSNIKKAVRYIWWSNDLNRVGMNLNE